MRKFKAILYGAAVLAGIWLVSPDETDYLLGMLGCLVVASGAFLYLEK